MSKESITQKQSIVMMITYMLGSSMVLGAGSEAKQDVWLALLIAMLMSVPVMYIYIRFHVIYPDKSLYEILNTVFGRVLGKIVAIPFIWFAFHLGALVLRNFLEYIKIVSMTQTPMFAFAIVMIISSIYGVRAGVEVIGRWTTIILPFLMLSVLIVTVFLSPLFDFGNLKPVLYNGFKPILYNAISALAFPFAETVIFTAVLDKIRDKRSLYKIYYVSLIFSGIVLIIISLRSILTLGAENVGNMYFASYAAVGLIDIGDFLERIEVSVTVVFLFGGYVKNSICLYAASTGIANVLNIDNYRQIVTPVGMLMLVFSFIIYNNTMEMFEWANKIYKYYAIPFEVVLPLIVLIVAEIKIRLTKKKKRA